MEAERLIKEGIMPVTESEKADSFDEMIFTNQKKVRQRKESFADKKAKARNKSAR